MIWSDPDATPMPPKLLTIVDYRVRYIGYSRQFHVQKYSHPKGEHMARWALLAAVALTWAAVAVAQSDFRLESELRTTYADVGNNAVLTCYTYNGSGERIAKTAYDGTDTLADELSTTAYTYDGNGNVGEELLLNAAGDTLSIVAYLYDASDNLVSTRVNRADGSLRFRDSLLYSGGNLTENHRYNAAGELTSYHAYSYSGGLRVSDSLFEDAGGRLQATQAVAFAHDGADRVVKESNYRLVTGDWYLISTVLLTYTDSLLAAVAEYEGDGSTERLMDSLAYSHDTWGNRIREEGYDDEAVLVYAIDYTWEDMRTSVAVSSSAPRQQRLSATHDGGMLRLRGAGGHCAVAVFDMAGKRVAQRTALSDSTGFRLAANLPAGRYVVRVSGATGRGAVALRVSN